MQTHIVAKGMLSQLPTTSCQIYRTYNQYCIIEDTSIIMSIYKKKVLITSAPLLRREVDTVVVGLMPVRGKNIRLPGLRR